MIRTVWEWAPTRNRGLQLGNACPLLHISIAAPANEVIEIRCGFQDIRRWKKQSPRGCSGNFPLLNGIIPNSMDLHQSKIDITFGSFTSIWLGAESPATWFFCSSLSCLTSSKANLRIHCNVIYLDDEWPTRLRRPFASRTARPLTTPSLGRNAKIHKIGC